MTRVRAKTKSIKNPRGFYFLEAITVKNKKLVGDVLAFVVYIVHQSRHSARFFTYGLERLNTCRWYYHPNILCELVII
jgi:hypothetical protein